MTTPDAPPEFRPRTEINITQVPVGELQIGMFVCKLDRPWIETPFLMQGFSIDCHEDIQQIAHYCRHVYVDEKKSITAPAKIERKMLSMSELFPDRQLATYTKQSSWTQELPEAQKSIQNLGESTVSMLKAIRSDTPFDMSKVKGSVSGVVDSVVRNPDTTMWLARLKTKDDYLYRHSMSCSIWAVALGRQIGLPKHDLRTLALGGLLFDIGKVRLPPGLLTKTGPITTQERKLLNRHVNEGLKAVQFAKNLGPDVIDIIKYHHERYDGSGYPEGLSGNQIPILARIMGIVDCYDAMTSERHFAKASSPSIVTRKLYAWRDKMFQAELVEEFIQAVGIYPAGTLVQMSTGEVGIVTSVSKTQRLRPTIIMLLDRDKKPLPDMKVIDLSETRMNDRGEALNIVKSLEPGAFGLDPTRF